MLACAFVRLLGCAPARTFVCASVCMCVCVRVCGYVCTFIYWSVNLPVFFSVCDLQDSAPRLLLSRFGSSSGLSAQRFSCYAQPRPCRRRGPWTGRALELPPGTPSVSAGSFGVLPRSCVILCFVCICRAPQGPGGLRRYLWFDIVIAGILPIPVCTPA